MNSPHLLCTLDAFPTSSKHQMHFTLPPNTSCTSPSSKHLVYYPSSLSTRYVSTSSKQQIIVLLLRTQDEFTISSEHQMYFQPSLYHRICLPPKNLEEFSTSSKHQMRFHLLRTQDEFPTTSEHQMHSKYQYELIRTLNVNTINRKSYLL